MASDEVELALSQSPNKKMGRLKLIELCNMDLNRMTIFQVQDLLSKKKISSVELTNFFLERIKDLDPKLKICLEVFETRARAQAVEADKRRSQGESGDLLGIPYLVKDNILVKGQEPSFEDVRELYCSI